MKPSRIIGVLGLCLVLSAFLGLPHGVLKLSGILVGVVTLCLGFAVFEQHRWEGWLAILAGVWVAGAPIIMPAVLDGGLYVRHALLSGLLIIVAGCAATRKPRRAHR